MWHKSDFCFCFLCDTDLISRVVWTHKSKFSNQIWATFVFGLKAGTYLITGHVTAVKMVICMLSIHPCYFQVKLHCAGADHSFSVWAVCWNHRRLLSHTAAAVGCPIHQPIESDCQRLSDGDSLSTYYDSVVRRQQRYCTLDSFRFWKNCSSVKPSISRPHHSSCTHTTLSTQLTTIAANRATGLKAFLSDSPPSQKQSYSLEGPFHWKYVNTLCWYVKYTLPNRSTWPINMLKIMSSDLPLWWWFRRWGLHQFISPNTCFTNVLTFLLF